MIKMAPSCAIDLTLLIQTAAIDYYIVLTYRQCFEMEVFLCGDKMSGDSISQRYEGVLGFYSSLYFVF